MTAGLYWAECNCLNYVISKRKAFWSYLSLGSILQSDKMETELRNAF